jgi:peptidoglycan/LPS O-acetylase OafA/YrhL
MLLIVRIITIIVSIAWFAVGGFLMIAGFSDEPSVDKEAITIGAAIIIFYLANLYLLYYSYKKKNTPTHWVAFLLGILPAVAITILVYALDNFDLF